MKMSIKFFKYLSGIMLIAALILSVTSAYALTAGETYTITIQEIESDGSVSSQTTSTTATADSNGKISFTFSSIPDNSSCNFMLVTIKDNATNPVRRSIVPCPDSGDSLPVGVSGLTNSQTDALLAALVSAGTDDPILSVFGLAIVRSTSATSAELTFMANLANQGISGTDGFIDYLTDNGVTSSQLTAYKNSIISLLADPDTGYSKLIKDSVDATTDEDKMNARGEAASKLLQFLVKAATTAGFSQDRVLEAFNAMGAIVVPLMQAGVSGGDLSAATAQMINSSIGGGIQKLKADKDIEKYSQALTALGATGTDVTSYQTAANALLSTMVTVFQTFEQVFDGNETDSEIQAAETIMQAAMQTAFNTFMSSTAASDPRINTMISNIDSALGSSTGLTIDEFQFYKSDGNQVNWPITMVIIVDWISSIVSDGGGMTYTRDTTAIPSNNEWMGSCSDNGFYDKDSCEGNGGTWTAGRTDFEGQGIPASYASIFGIQEDIMILEFTRWAAQESAGNDMSSHETLEKNFADSVAALAGNISGTTDGSTEISSTQESAIVTLLKSPQF